MSQAVGSKIQVWRGEARHTSGGLTKADLMINKRGKVVSRAKHEAGVRNKGNLGAYLQAPRGGKTQKGDGILGSIGDAIGGLFGLGLEPYSGYGGAIEPYSGAGGKLVKRGRGRPRGSKTKVPRRPRARKTLQKGEGFFDDVWDGVKKVGSIAAPALVPLAIGAAKSYMGGKLKKGRRKVTRHDRAVDRKNGRKARGW